MNLALWTAVARAFRRTALPLAAYYAITLALPLANGAARSGAAFIAHALVVLVVPPAIIVLACAVHTITRSCCNTPLLFVPRAPRDDGGDSDGGTPADRRSAAATSASGRLAGA